MWHRRSKVEFSTLFRLEEESGIALIWYSLCWTHWSKTNQMRCNVTNSQAWLDHHFLCRWEPGADNIRAKMPPRKKRKTEGLLFAFNYSAQLWQHPLICYSQKVPLSIMCGDILCVELLCPVSLVCLIKQGAYIESIWRPAETFSWNSGVFYDTLGTMYALPCVFLHIMPKQTFLWPFSINFWVFSSEQWKICCSTLSAQLFICLFVYKWWDAQYLFVF